MQPPQAQHLLFKLAASTGAIWEADLLIGKVAHSQRFWERLGYQPHEIPDTPESWAELLHPEDRDSVCRAWLNPLKRRAPYEVEYRSRAKSGDYRWFNSRGQATWDDSGRATYMAGVVHDITSHREAEERVQKIFHLTPTATSISRLGDACLLDVNDAFCALFGYTREELVGHSLLELGLIADLGPQGCGAGSARAAPARPRARFGCSWAGAGLVNAETIELRARARRVTINDVTDRKRYEAPQYRQPRRAHGAPIAPCSRPHLAGVVPGAAHGRAGR